MPLADAATLQGAPSRATTGAGGRRLSALAMVATVAAAVVLSVVTTTLVVGARVDDQLAQQAQTIHGLESATALSMEVSAEPDAEHVQLAGVSDPTLDGSLVFSPSTTELVITTTDLSKPAAGFEYRCWVEIDGKRQRIGKMFFGNDLAYWGGPVPAVADASGATTFGISLVAVSATSLDADPVLVSSQ